MCENYITTSICLDPLSIFWMTFTLSTKVNEVFLVEDAAITEIQKALCSTEEIRSKKETIRNHEITLTTTKLSNHSSQKLGKGCVLQCIVIDNKILCYVSDTGLNN